MPSTTPTVGQKTLRRTWRAARLLLAGYLTLILVAMWFENRLIFYPFAYPAGNWQPVDLPVEDAWFKTPDGTQLHGWYLPHPNAQATVLFCHGNAGNVTHRAIAMAMLHQQAKVSVLVFDYRGFGRSQGKPNGENILADARAARRWLAEREKVAERDIVILGESIGGAVAVDLAARDGARALILESTFDSLPEVAAYHYPWLPVRWAMRTRLDSAALIGQYHGPVFQAHGAVDTLVPLANARRLFDAAQQPKQFLLLGNHNHNNLMPAEYYDALAAFIEKAVKP
ncbi:MAG: alpha/beta hydrolase [Thermoguttaceae bacterium]